MAQLIKVLLVEDTPLAQMIEKAQMIQQDCEVDIAIDGETALEKAMENPYDLILMDIGLGDGPDGFEVTSQIKKLSLINKSTPIVALTAHGEREYMDKASDVGIDHYFNKPFTPADAKVIVDYIKSKKKESKL